MTATRLRKELTGSRLERQRLRDRGQLYLLADFLVPWKRWPHQVRRDDRVRLRFGSEVFACRLQEVDDPALVQAVRESIAAKCSIAPDGRAARVEIW